MTYFLVIDNIDEVLSWLEPAERWDLFLEPLIQGLNEAKLGTVLDVESLVEESGGQKRVISNEIAIEVSNFEKAQALLCRIQTAARAAKDQ